VQAVDLDQWAPGEPADPLGLHDDHDFASAPVDLAPATERDHTRALTVGDVAFATLPVPVSDFADAPIAKPRWAVQDFWPEGASGIIGGRPKGGKSTVAVELAVSLWSGTPMFGNPAFPVVARPAPVLYVQQENATPRVQRDVQQVLTARGLGTIRYVNEDGEELLPGYAPEDVDDALYERYEPGPEREELPAFEVWSQPGLDLANRKHQDALRAYVVQHGFRYVFLDPLYMLVAVKVTDGGDELRPVLTWLKQLQGDTGTAPILTHHMSDKDGSPFDATSLLGTTFIHGWYDAAILTRRDDDAVFHVKVDALRDMAHVGEVVVSGLGVGRWFYAPGAQGSKDAAGRSAPRVSGKETKKALLVETREAHPEYSYDQLEEATGIPKATISRYLKELREEGA